MVGAVLLAGCAHEAPPAATPSAAAREGAPATAPPAPSTPPQYVVGDPARPSALTLLPLSESTSGVILEGQRFTLGPEGARAAGDVAEAPLAAAWRVPKRLGGGFLFRERGTLYASATFEGLLRPVVALPADVAQVSFGPSAALVRADDGERWEIDLATGRRLPVSPPGLLDVAALDDGRAAALVDGGLLLVSTDGGAHWLDVSARLRSPAKRLLVDAGGPGAGAGGDPSLWFETQAGLSARIMLGGRVAEYDAGPPALPPSSLRPKDPAWREDDPPLRRAMRFGAPFGEGAALVVASGDLARVELATGAVTVVAAGKLPDKATCAGTRTADDILFTCGRNEGAFVVSHALSGAPVVEQNFVDAGRFVVADDGGLAFLGACDKPTPRDRRAVCVRQPDGRWLQYDPEPSTDAGAGPPAFHVVRWIPRADGDAIAVVTTIGGVQGAWGLVDGRTGEVHAWASDVMTPVLQNALEAAADTGRSGAYDAFRLADRAWTVTPHGTLRGWATYGGGVGAVEVGVDGSMQTSAFTFDRVSGAGPVALARLRDGRIWQTTDRGATWSEVAAPSAAKPGGYLDPHACSLVGCDLAQWYRVGWTASPPVPVPPLAVAPPAPRVDRTTPPTLSCRPAGDARRAQVTRGDHSPDDMGLGARRVPVADASGRTDFLDVSFGRRVVGAVRDPGSGDDGAARAFVHGPSTQPGDDRLVVMAPNRDAMSLVRTIDYVPPFDPLAPVRSASLAMTDVVAAARASGLPAASALQDDPVPSGVIPVTPIDPTAPGDLLVAFADGGVALARTPANGPGGASRAQRARVVFEVGRADDRRILGAVEQDGDALAWLDEDAQGQAHVLRVGSGAPSSVFELDAPPSEALYPANVDALAVGPHGELGVLRTPSGAEPPSAIDPAVVILPGAGALPLAPWSTILPADDPACRADSGGWRATLQTMAPWLRVAGPPELRARAEDTPAPMLARVKWSPARVCLEAVEVRVADTGDGSTTSGSPFGSVWDAPLETWLVARFAGGPAAARVLVVHGGELRQPFDCTLAPLAP
jgi:hypothetical protein